MGMRLSKKNKQKMKYSVPLESGQPIYKTDDEGNIEYIHYTDSDGNITYYTDDNGDKIPLIEGYAEGGYSEPQEFEASISSEDGEYKEAPFGYSNADFEAKITTVRNEYPFTKGTLVWTDNEVEKDDDGVVRASANFEIIGILPSLNFCSYLLKGVQNG